MCRTGGRRCPSSRTRARGGTRGQPRPAVLNIVTGNASVGGQYDDARIHGGVTITPSGVTITGPVTGTPSAQPTAGQAAAAEATAARAMQTARNAARAASDAARTGHAAGDTANAAGDGDVIAAQIGGRTYRY
jgi:hypothetical protein